MLPMSPAAPKTETDKSDADDKACSREERRRQLAELVGRLLARQWVDCQLVKPMPGDGENHAS